MLSGKGSAAGRLLRAVFSDLKEFARLKAETDGGIAVETVINLRGAVYLSGGSMRGGRKEAVLSDYAELREEEK